MRHRRTRCGFARLRTALFGVTAASLLLLSFIFLSAAPFAPSVSSDAVNIDAPTAAITSELRAETAAEASETRPWHFVCLLGNAETVSLAARAHGLWGDGRFPSYWLIWNEPDGPDPPQQGQEMRILRAPRGTTNWRSGVATLLPLLRQRWDCQYLFIHDDDLAFRVVRGEHQAVDDALIHILTRYQPAIAGFGWPKLEAKVPTAQAVAEHFSVLEVAPLSTFDSGMVLYHRDVVDLFIPHPPAGEGGQLCAFAACSVFQNFIASVAFRKGQALRINSIVCENLISFGNAFDTRRGGDVAGVTMAGKPRHEGDKNYLAYANFINSALWEIGQKWGRWMRPSDFSENLMTARPFQLQATSAATQPPGLFEYSREEVVQSISDVTDLSHPALSYMPFLKPHPPPPRAWVTVVPANETDLKASWSPKDRREIAWILPPGLTPVPSDMDAATTIANARLHPRAAWTDAGVASVFACVSDLRSDANTPWGLWPADSWIAFTAWMKAENGTLATWLSFTNQTIVDACAK